MSLLKKLASVFKGRKEELHAKMVNSTEQTVQPHAAINENVIYVYSHGFTNGVYRVEPGKDHFEDFLQASNESDKITELRKLNQKKLYETRETLNARQAAFDQLQEMHIDRGRTVEHITSKVEEIDEAVSGNKEKQQALLEQRKQTHAEYAWVPALLYLVAGIVFIVGDISITHQITSWGFDMKGIEGWIFAVGLAFTAFLIKPVVDRLLEKPFQKAGLQMKKVYRAVLLMITVLGIVMLFLLGKFRSESQVAATKLGDINYQMQSLSDPNSKEYVLLAEERKKINEALTSNAVGEWGIILSGIIFAIGGALCMAIAFPSLSQLINRYWILPFQITMVRRRIDRLNKLRHELKDEMKQVRGDILKAEHQLKGFDFDQIKEEIAALEEQESRLLVNYYETQFNREKNLYLDGKNRGEKYTIDGELLYKAMDKDPTDLYHKNGSSSGSDAGSKIPRRPFVKIRKMIADNYNKNQNNNSPDGTEFEILS